MYVEKSTYVNNLNKSVKRFYLKLCRYSNKEVFTEINNHKKIGLCLVIKVTYHDNHTVQISMKCKDEFSGDAVVETLL